MLFIKGKAILFGTNKRIYLYTVRYIGHYKERSQTIMRIGLHIQANNDDLFRVYARLSKVKYVTHFENGELPKKKCIDILRQSA